MRILITIFFCSVILFSCKEGNESHASNVAHGFSIRGASITNKGYVFLQKYNTNNELAIIDSVRISDGSFQFKGYVDYLEPYQIIVNEEVYPLILENTEYQLSDNAIIGTQLQEDYNAYYQGLKSTENPFVYQRDFINSHPRSMLSAIVLKTMLGTTAWRIDQNRQAFNILDASIKTSQIGVEIDKFINTQEDILKDKDNMATLSLPKERPESTMIDKKEELAKPKPISKKQIVQTITRDVPYTGVDFEADDIHGNNFKLSDISTRSKYVLIDFWASWCAPCRKQNPYLVEVYNRYHDKGFDIVSVSEDRSKLAWKNAIENDGLTWHHVIDDFNRLSNLYKIESIPHTMLINGKGEVIASDISPYILKTRLGGLLRQ